MKLFIPSLSGDYRLEPDGTWAKLHVSNPTSGERTILRAFLLDCANRKYAGAAWVDKVDPDVECQTIKAPYEQVAKRLMRAAAPPKKRRLVAIVSTAGYVSVSEDYPATITAETEAIAAMPKPEASSWRPRDPPHNVRAAEVMRAFVTPEQFDDWTRREAFVARGGTTGARYLVVHREGPLAERYGSSSIVLDSCVIDYPGSWGRGLRALRPGADVAVHCLAVPPEEEALTLALMIEHRERELHQIAANPSPIDPTMGVAALAGAVLGSTR